MEKHISSISDFDIKRALQNLYIQRHLFANEVDLQVSLCIEIKKIFQENPNIFVVPEFTYLGENLDGKPFPDNPKEKKSYCDIVVFDKSTNDAIAIELKFKVTTDYKRYEAFKRPISLCSLGKSDLSYYYFSNQDASDDGSLLFLEDMYRIQQIVGLSVPKHKKYDLTIDGSHLTAVKGFCVLITNDCGYWNEPTAGTKGAATRIFNSSFNETSIYEIPGYVKDKKSYSFPVEIPDNKFLWKDYSKVKHVDEGATKKSKKPNKSHEMFKILVLEYLPCGVKSVDFSDFEDYQDVKEMGGFFDISNEKKEKNSN